MRPRAVTAALVLTAAGLGALTLHEALAPPRRLWVLASKGYLVGGLPGSWFTKTPWRVSASPGGAPVEGWRATTFGLADDPFASRGTPSHPSAVWHVSRLDLVRYGDDPPRLWTAVRERLGMTADARWAYVPTGEAADVGGETWREVRRE